MEIAWINGGFRPVYGKREIRRGKNKGRFEVQYRANGNVMRTKIITKDCLKLGGQFETELRGKIQPKKARA
jgi:hypothetical protein